MDCSHYTLSLQVTSVLQVLDLSDNDFGCEDSRLLTRVLKTQDTLTELDYSMNPIGVAGAIDFANALKDNRMLKV
jgi:Ran GTPase-activating protein (RanGAP) involved in mRNA processing and transport